MIHLLHYGEDLCLSWCRGHRHRLIVFSCSATTSCSGVCRLVQMTKGMGWECVVKWHRVTKSENNIKRLEIKANIMNNKWAQGKEKWWVMGLKEFVIIINNFFFSRYDTLALFMVLWKHQFACSDMLNGTVDYQKMIHSLCLQGFISQKLSGPSTPAGDALPIAKFISLYWLQRRPPPWPPIHSSTQFILKLWLWFRPACLNRIN